MVLQEMFGVKSGAKHMTDPFADPREAL